MAPRRPFASCMGRAWAASLPHMPAEDSSWFGLWSCLRWLSFSLLADTGQGGSGPRGARGGGGLRRLWPMRGAM